MIRRAVLLLATGGCFAYSELPNGRPDPKIRTLADATILDMKINLKSQPGLCPGHEGKLYVNATVRWPGMQPVLRSLGNDVDSLDPASFAISGPLLTGDPQAHLHPDPDVLKSITSGFEIDVTYKLQPRFSFHDMFPPEYSCFTGFYAPGDQGNGGQDGDQGGGGDYGQSGGHGGNGGPGRRGGDGGRIQAYVTVVSTKFYPRLYAVIANDQFFLAPARRRLVFAALGGAGGQGGSGGNGGRGGDQQTKSVDRSDGNGGTTTVIVGVGGAGNGGGGGDGGDGGVGGNGGSVEVTYDTAFPELRDFIAIDVSGGGPGAGGPAASGGSGGNTNASENAQQGQQGPEGRPGRDGMPGRDGRASVHSGAIAGAFRSIRGIQPATDGAAPEAPQPPPRRRHR